MRWIIIFYGVNDFAGNVISNIINALIGFELPEAVIVNLSVIGLIHVQTSWQENDPVAETGSERIQEFVKDSI